MTELLVARTTDIGRKNYCSCKTVKWILQEYRPIIEVIEKIYQVDICWSVQVENNLHLINGAISNLPYSFLALSYESVTAGHKQGVFYIRLWSIFCVNLRYIWRPTGNSRLWTKLRRMFWLVKVRWDGIMKFISPWFVRTFIATLVRYEPHGWKNKNGIIWFCVYYFMERIIKICEKILF